MTTQDLKKSKHVIYASNGICLIEEIKKISFVKGEPEKIYFILKPLNDKNSTIYIPEDNQLLLDKIRNTVTEKEIIKITQDTKIGNVEWIDDRKQRSAQYRKLLSSPHPSELLPVIKSIEKKKSELAEVGKKLSAADKEMLDASLCLVKDEFAFALKPDKATKYIADAIGYIPSQT